MLTLTVVGSYGQVHYTAVPSSSFKITVSTFEEKQISILDSEHIVRYWLGKYEGK